MVSRKSPCVSVLSTKPETVMQDYGRLMQLSRYRKYVFPDRDTVLKLNLSWSLYYPSCSTQPWQLDGVLKTMVNDGFKKIIPVENKTVVTNPWKGARQNKWLPVLEKYGLGFQPLTEVPWSVYSPRAETPALDSIFPDGLKIPGIFRGKNMVHLPTQKCHGHTTITGSMKNAFGGLITERRHHSHKRIHEVLVDLLSIQKEIHPGIFTVMDGTVAGNGAGPRTMEPVVENYILASADSVAIDAVSAKMMGFEPMKIPFIKLANDRGLGCGDIQQIDVTGADIRKVNYGFRVSKSPVIMWDQILRKRLPFIEPLLFHTPLFSLCIFASAFYHDRLWYPLVGRSKIRAFDKTGWGALFRQYA